MKRFFSAALLLLFFCGAAQAGTASVTTGAGYMKMVQELAALYKERASGSVQEVYGGNIGQMLAQIEAGNGVNVVISDKGTLLAAKSNVEIAEMQPLGSTVLVLAWRKGLELSSPDGLSGGDVKAVAYPDPKAAIYGRAAAQFLESTGLGAKLGEKLSQVSTVPQVFSYVASGEMDAGFVNRVVVRAGADKIGGSLEITSGYEPIEMVAAVVKGSEQDPDVVSFLKFLGGAEAKAVMKKHGVE